MQYLPLTIVNLMVMLSKKNLLLIWSLFIIFSCEKDPSITFIETNFNNENNTIVDINIPIANGNDAVSESINLVIKKHVISALQLEESDSLNPKSIEEGIASFNKEFNAFLNDFPDSAQKWEAQIDGDIMYQSPEIISIALTSYIDTGGAHGMLDVSFLNFNPLTGKRILNDNLFTDMEVFKQISKKQIEETIEDKDTPFKSENFILPANIGYTEEGIILLYNAYEIAPYSEGIIDFTIPYDSISYYLNYQ